MSAARDVLRWLWDRERLASIIGTANFARMTSCHSGRIGPVRGPHPQQESDVWRRSRTYCPQSRSGK